MLAGACVGDIGGDEPTDTAMCTSPSAGPAPLRRLTKTEYGFSIEDLFGYPATVADALPDEQFGNDGFDNYAQNANIGQLRADMMFEAAETVADATAQDLTGLLPCDPTAVDTACIDDFIRTVGRRSYRRPLEEAELTILREAYDTDADLVLAERVANVLQALLMAPQFVFRPENDSGAGVVQLTGFELATRLSYLLWASTPDEVLLAAAEHGELDDSAGVEAHARRLLADPKARRGVVRFMLQWLDIAEYGNINRDTTLYPEFSTELLASIREQTTRFIERTVLQQDGSLIDLLTSREVQVDEPLASLYGLPYPGGEQWVDATLPEGERKGMLTLAAWLTKFGFSKLPATFRRGKWVRVRLLCGDLSPPDPDADLSPVELEPGMTNRQALEARLEQSQSCQGCHSDFSDFGYAFESFDSIGQHRTSETNGAPIDASGSVQSSDVDGPFSSWSDLIDKLATSQQVSDCMAEQAFRYGFGRRPASDDQCTVDELTDASFPSIRDLLVDIATSDGFRFKLNVQEGS